MKTVVARGIRYEVDELTGKMYLIFEVVDEGYKKHIYTSWRTDEDVELNGKDLIRK